MYLFINILNIGDTCNGNGKKMLTNLHIKGKKVERRGLKILLLGLFGENLYIQDIYNSSTAIFCPYLLMNIFVKTYVHIFVKQNVDLRSLKVTKAAFMFNNISCF